MEDRKGTLVVAEAEYLPFLFEHLGKDLSKNVTIWSVEDLFNNAGDKVSVDAIPYLRKKGYGYGQAKKYSALLSRADYSRNRRLSSLREELYSQKRITPNPLGTKRLEAYKVYLFERQEDHLVHNFLKRRHILAQDMSISSLNLENRFTPLNHPYINLFSDKFHQFMYIFASIRKKILESNDDKIKSDITIHVNGEEDAFFVQNIGKLFNLPVTRKISSPFLAEEGVRKKIESIYKTKDFVFTDEERKIKERKSLSDRINKYKLNEVKQAVSFPFAFSNLLEIISHQKRQSYTDNKGIRVTDSFTFRPNQIVYVCDFVFPRFYREFKDNSVLSDDELLEIGANPSYILTNLDKRRKKNYLSYRNIVLLSRVKQHLQENIFPSPFLSELNTERKKRKKENPDIVLPPLSHQEDYNPEGVYTTKARNIYLSSQRDSLFRFSPYLYQGKIQGDEISFNGYDHSFKGLEENSYPLPDHFSVTNLESYILCPFKYYRESIIPDQVQDYFTRFRGTRIHAAFESIHHQDFDFDSAFQHGKEALREDRKNRGQEFDKQRELTVENIRLWLKVIAGELRNQAKENASLMENKNDAEQRIEFTLKDGEKEYRFHGQIDKLLFTENEGRHFYTIVDYKTGIESFVPRETLFGRSIQLPLYAYAIEQKRKEAVADNRDSIPYRPNLKSTFGGFAIEHIYASSPKGRFSAKKDIPVLSKEGLDQTLCLSGAVLEDETYLKSITKFYKKDKEDGLIITNEVTYRKDNSINLSRRTFLSPVCTFTDIEQPAKTDKKHKKRDRNQIFRDSKASALAIIHQLENGFFPIAPTSNPLNKYNVSNLQCKYCNFKNVCYRRSSDAVNYNHAYKKIRLEREKAEKKGD